MALLMELPFDDLPPAGDSPVSSRDRDKALLHDMRSMQWPERAPHGAVHIYTDGACSGNPGPGGWAWAVAPDGEPYGSGGERPSTNQRMEIRAVIEALRAFRDHTNVIVIVSDSTYVVNCFRQRWWQGWLSRGWKNSQRQPVANRELWEDLFDELVSRGSGKTVFQWVKGHSGDPMNDLVDTLAVQATGA